MLSPAAALSVARIAFCSHLKVSERFDLVRRKVLSLNSLLIKLYVAATIAALQGRMHHQLFGLFHEQRKVVFLQQDYG